MQTRSDKIEAANEANNLRFYRFGEFQVDVVEEAIYRNGEKLQINRRTYQVLLLLLERAEEIVTKKDFFDVVWAETFVSDNSLTVAMTALRKILHDDAKNAKFIENLPRKGYRFIAEVEIIKAVPPSVRTKEQAEEKSETTPTTPTTPTTGSATNLKNRKTLAAIFAFCLLAFIAVVG
ncbi:MAG: winged helix-turn-helix domain-containing protein, partial [Pyrinomonadaceae bacterium]|nr:winged helix-turn-helix domain-containing protein [Pyrinomonadaceae bacterium]